MTKALTYLRHISLAILGTALAAWACFFAPALGVTPPMWIGIHILLVLLLGAVAWFILRFSAVEPRRIAMSFFLTASACGLIAALILSTLETTSRLASSQVAGHQASIAFTCFAMAIFMGGSGITFWKRR